MGYTRREFLRRGGLWALGTTLGASALLSACGGKSAPAPASAPTTAPEHEDYFSTLYRVLDYIRNEPNMENFASVYLGNVNDYDHGGVNAVTGAQVTVNRGGKREMFEIEFDNKGNQSSHTIVIDDGPERKEILQDGVSEYMWHIPRDKKIKLDIIEIGGGGAGAIESLQRATLTRGIGYNIEQSLRQLLPGIAIEITERGIDGVLPGTELVPDTWYVDGAEPGQYKNGKLWLPSDRRCLILTDRPLKSSPWENSVALGYAHMNSNLAVVDLTQMSGPETVRRVANQEVGHSVGVNHCWEDACDMSYRTLPQSRGDHYVFVNPGSDTANGFGPRCQLVGKNIAARYMDVNPEKASYVIKSGHTIQQDDAERDMEAHLRIYLSDLIPGRPLPSGVEMKIAMGIPDKVWLYHDGKPRMYMEMPDLHVFAPNRNSDFIGKLELYDAG